MFTQSMTFIGSLDSLSLETSIRRRADARRGTRNGPQYAFGIHPAIDTCLHGLPDMREILVDLFLAVQRQFVLHSGPDSEKPVSLQYASSSVADLNGYGTLTSLAAS